MNQIFVVLFQLYIVPIPIKVESLQLRIKKKKKNTSHRDGRKPTKYSLNRFQLKNIQNSVLHSFQDAHAIQNHILSAGIRLAINLLMTNISK